LIVIFHFLFFKLLYSILFFCKNHNIINIFINFLIFRKINFIIEFKNGDWGLGIGDWGLGIGPNPQSPIPNPHIILFSNFFKKNYIKNNNIIYSSIYYYTLKINQIFEKKMNLI